MVGAGGLLEDPPTRRQRILCSLEFLSKSLEPMVCDLPETTMQSTHSFGRGEYTTAELLEQASPYLRAHAAAVTSVLQALLENRSRI